MINNPYQLINVGGRKKIQLSEIIMLQADVNYTYIHLIDGSKIMVSYTLKKLAERFIDFEYFIRPNKSVLMNIKYATSFDGMFLQISLPTGEVLQNAAISRRKRPFILERMTAFSTAADKFLSFD